MSFPNQVPLWVTRTILTISVFVIKMEFCQATKTKKKLNFEEDDLVDKGKDIFDPVLSFDPFELYQKAMQNSKDLVDHYHA